MPTNVPNDSVLLALLSSGAFETVVRIGGGRESNAPAAASLLKRFPGLSLEGATWLAAQAERAYDAARNLKSYRPDQSIDPRELPTVPSQAIPGAEPGDIVVLGNVIAHDTPSTGKSQAVSVTSVYGSSPSWQQLANDRAKAAQAVAAKYDKLHEMAEEDLDALIDEIMGVFVVGSQ